MKETVENLVDGDVQSVGDVQFITPCIITLYRPAGNASYVQA